MKKLLIITAMVGGSLCVFAADDVAHLARHKAPAQATESTSALWRAGTENLYEWYDEWMPIEKYERTYNQYGYPLTVVLTAQDETGAPAEYTRMTYTYDGASPYYSTYITEASANGTDYINVEKTERSYDSRVPGLVLDNAVYNWANGQWTKNSGGNNYTRTVTRNEAGNVTQVVVAVPYMGILDPIDRLTIEYGTDGKAVKITHEVLVAVGTASFDWALDQELSNIVWKETNGQITSIDYLPSTENAPLSADVKFNDGSMGTVTYSYPDNKGSYVSTYRRKDDFTPLTIINRLNILDEYGSYDYESTQITGVGNVTTSITALDKYHVDAYGLETLIYRADIENGKEEVLGQSVGEVTYDANNGYPLTYILRELDMDTNRLMDMMKIEFSDYVDCSGVADITIDDADAPVVIYDLNGKVVTNPTPGLYIRRQGGNVAKVIIR